MALTETLVEASWQPARSDAKLCIRHREATQNDGMCPITGKPYTDKGMVPLGVLAIHVDDFKGACEETTGVELFRRLGAKYGKCELIEAPFECVGVQHRQDTKTVECTMDQNYYASQLKSLPTTMFDKQADSDKASDEQ
eukprot:5374044-Pyramimonas_sp.AAC.1